MNSSPFTLVFIYLLYAGFKHTDLGIIIASFTSLMIIVTQKIALELEKRDRKQKLEEDWLHKDYNYVNKKEKISFSLAFTKISRIFVGSIR
jgi:hypothetical protein